jgi:hypothetical protein
VVTSVVVRLLLEFQWKNQFLHVVCAVLFSHLISSDPGALFERSREVAGSGLSSLVILGADCSS